jgi:MSHA biogenesis protein MshI
MPPHQYSVRLVDAPEVEPGELAAAARWLVTDLIDFDVNDAVVDYFAIPNQQARGRPARLHVVAARTHIAQGLADLVSQAGLQLEAIDITELSLRNLAARLEEDARGVAFMQLRRERGLLIMVQGGEVYLTRELDVGLEALMQEMGASDPFAVLDLGEGWEALDALVLEVQRSLDYYESQLGQPPVASLVLAPLEHELPELVPQLEKRLTVSVRSSALDEMVACDAPPAVLNAMLVSAVGAALREVRTA